MNIFLLIASLLCFPTLIGCGAVRTYLKIKSLLLKTDFPNRNSVLGRISAYFTSGTIIIVLYAGIINILTVLTNMQISKASKIFGYGIVIISLISVFMTILLKPKKNAQGNSSPQESLSKNKSHISTYFTKATSILPLVSILIAIIQIILVSKGNQIPYFGDQTVETVVSFVNTNHVYSVDPLTGLPYLNGYPLRLSLQCLPLFYAAVSSIFSLQPVFVVWRIMPIFWLICSYFAIYRIADSLFKKKSRKYIMLICFELLLWCSNVALGGTGYSVFHAGFASATVLELLLIYWTIGTVLSHNYTAILISVAAEPLVASTRFGVGACFFIAFIFFVITKIPYVKRLIAALDTIEGGNDGKA